MLFSFDLSIFSDVQMLTFIHAGALRNVLTACIFVPLFPSLHSAVTAAGDIVFQASNDLSLATDNSLNDIADGNDA
jgi:hypothetical protein